MVPSMRGENKSWGWLEKRQLAQARGGTTAPGRRRKLAREGCTPRVWWSSSRSTTPEGTRPGGSGRGDEQDSVLVGLEALEARRRLVEEEEGPRRRSDREPRRRSTLLEKLTRGAASQLERTPPPTPSKLDSGTRGPMKMPRRQLERHKMMMWSSRRFAARSRKP